MVILKNWLGLVWVRMFSRLHSADTVLNRHPSQSCDTGTHTDSTTVDQAPPHRKQSCVLLHNHAHSSLDTPLCCNDTHTTELVQV